MNDGVVAPLVEAEVVGLAVAAPHAVAVGDQLAGVGVRVCEGPKELLQNASLNGHHILQWGLAYRTSAIGHERVFPVC